MDAAQELAACGVEWTPGAVHELVVTLDGPRVSVSVDGVVCLTSDAGGAPLGEAARGRLGVRAWGGGLSFDELVMEDAGGRHELRGDAPRSPRWLALESLCVLMFNLNEFLFVD